MAETNTLEIVIKTVDKATAQIASIGKAITGLVGLVAGAYVVKKTFDAVTGAISEATAAASEAEAVDQKLLHALSTLGPKAVQTFDDMAEFASGLQLTTRFGDEAIRSNMALLASLGRLSGEGLKEATKASMDLAEGIGTDLEGATKLLAKAAQGNTAMLGRYGIVISENIPKNERFAEVLKQINGRFGGLSETMGGTFQGRLTQIRNQFGEVYEALGKNITQSPELIAAFESIKEALVKFVAFLNSEDFRAAIGSAVLGLAKMAKTATVVAGSISYAFGESGKAARASLEATYNEIEKLEKSVQAFADKRKELAALQEQVAKVGFSATVLARIKELEGELRINIPTAAKATAAAFEDAGDAAKKIDLTSLVDYGDTLLDRVATVTEELNLEAQLLSVTRERSMEQRALAEEKFNEFFLGEQMHEVLLQQGQILDDQTGKWMTIGEYIVLARDRLDEHTKQLEQQMALYSILANTAADLGAEIVGAALSGQRAWAAMFRAFFVDIAKAITRALILAVIMTYVRGGTGLAFSANFMKAFTGVNSGGQVLRANTGLQVPGPRLNMDMVPALLTPGEVVLRTPVVEAIEQRLLNPEAQQAPSVTLNMSNHFSGFWNRTVVEDFVRRVNELAEHMGVEVVATRVANG